MKSTTGDREVSPTIERSTGLVAHVGIMPFVIGGGYRGASVDLDSQVGKAAGLLRDMFDHPITIRFNSDRLSGGAWLKTSEIDGFGKNCEIEIGAHTVNLTETRKLFDKYPDWHANRTWAEYCADRLADPDGPERQVVYCAYILRDYLRPEFQDDPAVLNDIPDDPSLAKAYHHFRTLAEAAIFVHQHAVADPRPVTQARARARQDRIDARIKQTEEALAGLSKAQLTAVAWEVPYGFRPHGFGFKNPKENKDQIRDIILRAARAGYVFDPRHAEVW